MSRHSCLRSLLPISLNGCDCFAAAASSASASEGKETKVAKGTTSKAAAASSSSSSSHHAAGASPAAAGPSQGRKSHSKKKQVANKQKRQEEAEVEDPLGGGTHHSKNDDGGTSPGMVRANSSDSHDDLQGSPPSHRKKKRERGLFEESSHLGLSRSLRSTGTVGVLHEGFNMDLPFGKALSSASQAIARSEEEAAALAIRMIEEQQKREEEEAMRKAKTEMSATKKARKAQEQPPPTPSPVNGAPAKKRGRPTRSTTLAEQASGSDAEGEMAMVKEEEPAETKAAGGEAGEREGPSSVASPSSVGTGSGRRGPLYGDEPPHHLEFVSDRNTKTLEPNSVLYIHVPEVKRELFDWTSG